MENAFQLQDPANAQAYLQRFARDTKRTGEGWFRDGLVAEFLILEPGTAYCTTVGAPPEQAETRLNYHRKLGWYGSCSCLEGNACAHAYAAMCALLAEYRTSVVRNLSAGTATAEVMVHAAAGGPPDLLRQVASGLGRTLRPEEKRFVMQVRTCFRRCRQHGYISRWDFSEMGLALPGSDFTWGAVEIWPAMPEDEVEFWQYVANAAEQAQATIPRFMREAIDLEPIRKKMARWHRDREVKKWKEVLRSVPVFVAPPRPENGHTDLRLVLEEQHARIEWLPPGAVGFEAMKPTHLHRLWNSAHEELSLTPEAELLWSQLSTRVYAPPSNHFRYTEPESLDALRRIFRSPQLESRLLTHSGEPLKRPTEPLRWDVVPAAQEADDYLIRLAQADGSACPPIWAVISGQPTLYLTPQGLFKGPAGVAGLLNLTGTTRIPAPALETEPGVALLRSIAVEFPPRIREKVRLLPMQVTITAELRPPADGRHEECALLVTAQAEDGWHETYFAGRWENTAPRKSVKPKPSGTITLYDHAVQGEIPRLLEPLNLKTEIYGQHLCARVTRRFPEDFAAWLRSVPPDITVRLEGELSSFAEGAISGRVQLEVTETEIDWFDLRVVLDISDTTLTKEETKLLLGAKGRFVRLEGRGWRRLQFDLSPEEDERLARLGLNPRELSDEPQRLHALQLADEAAKKFLPAEQAEQIHRRADELKARVSPPLPAGVTAQLRPYQLEGFHFLAYLSANRFGGILADDMGLGKTLQTLSWLLWLRQEKLNTPGPAAGGEGMERAVAAAPRCPPSLVVCPKSVMDNWHAEAARFTPGLRVKIWSGGEMAAFLNGLAEADLHVINYAQLRGLGESLRPVRWHAVILDEGQYIKNPGSITAQVARILGCEHRLVLSGTPIENRLLDLWSLMSFVMPGVLGSRAHFGRIYDAKGDPLARKRLAARVRPFLIRRTKSQVASDLPDRIEEDLSCEIEGEQKTLYRAELKRAQQMLLAIQTQKELADQAFYFLVSLLRLRQICCDPRLVDAKSKAPSAKVEALMEQLEPLMEEGQKVLVFSQFVTMLDLLRTEMEELEWPIFYLAGDTENRGELVNQFQTKEGPAVFLISLKAGGYGLNLTAASYVFLFDPWWNPAVENQAIDRTHRIGQTNKVIAYRLLIKDSIEEKIRLLQKKKQALVEDVLGEERFGQNLTIEDLRFLFAD